MPLRLAFAGTPAFAAQALQAVQAAGHRVVRVLTQPDRPAGRGMALQASPVKLVAQRLGLPVSQPRGLRLDGRHGDDARAVQAELQGDRLDGMVVAAYGLILPTWVLATPRLGCLNIHASLLPRWRGAAPIQRALEAGDTDTGITIMQMDEGLDTGDMLMQAALPIGPDETAARLHDRLATLGAELIVRALEASAAGPLKGQPQDASRATYAHKIDKAEAPLDWSAPAATLERRIRAFDPFPGACMTWGAEAVKVWGALAHPAAVPAAPGTVVALDAHRLAVACGEGVLELVQVQRPGGRRIAFDAFRQSSAGSAFRAGARLAS